jgi:glycosyltransferase involved in cell wall biosynthesis
MVVPTLWVPAVLRSVPRWSKYAAIPRRDNVEGFTVEYPRVLCFPGGRFFYLYGFFYYLRLLALVKRQVSGGGIDLIHAHAIMPDGFAGALLGRRLRLPVVCTVHGSDVNSYPHRNRATCWATKWALRNVGGLITVSRALEGGVFSLIGCRQIEVVHNGADYKKFKPKPREEARARLNLPIDKKIILFVGGLVPVKGVEFLLAAISRLGRPDAVLYLVGDGELKAALISMADRLGVLNICRFVGRRPYDEISSWLSAADCLVLPSLSEGFPTILPEAMLCRVPIVATEVGGIPEIISHGHNGLLVEPKNITMLAEAIQVLLTNDEEIPVMVERAHKTARAAFTWEANAQKMLAIYRKIAFLATSMP